MLRNPSSMDGRLYIDGLYKQSLTKPQITPASFFKRCTVTPFIVQSIVRPGVQVRPDTMWTFKPLDPL